MKKLFMLVAFLGLVNFAAEAQCTKSAKTAGAKTACCAKTAAAAVKAASLDESIEKKVCEKSGSVSYVKKSVCEKSGTVSYSNVEYCSKSQKFVNVSPSEVQSAMMVGEVINVSDDAAPVSKKACAGKSAKKCCKSGAKAKACSKKTEEGTK